MFLALMFVDSFAETLIACCGSICGDAVGRAEDHAEEDANDDGSQRSESEYGHDTVPVLAPFAGIEVVDQSADILLAERHRFDACQANTALAHLIQRKPDWQDCERIGDHLQAREDGQVRTE